MIKHENVNKIILLIMVTGISALFLTMIRQFLMAIFMAGLFSAMSAPVHRWLTPRLNNRENLASTLIIIAIVCLILIPLALLISVVIGQAVHVGQSVSPWIESFVEEPGILSDHINKIPHYEILLPYRDMILEKAGEIVGIISNLLISSLTSLSKITINALFNIVIMLYVMFYFLSMGEVLLKKILYYLPMSMRMKNASFPFHLCGRSNHEINLYHRHPPGRTLRLCLFLAGIQGAVFWGTVMAVLSIIPAVGTAVVWPPALAILAIGGDFSGVIILAIICGAVAGNMDNLLRPRLVGKDTEMHDLFVLFGTLGGIALFGVLGIIIGPIISALFITIWEIYGDAFHEYLPEVGSLHTEQAEPEEQKNEEVLPEE